MKDLFGAPEVMDVRVSSKMARLLFDGCDPTFIREVCHGQCCTLKSAPTGTRTYVEPDQIVHLTARGIPVGDGLIVTSKDPDGVWRCPAQADDGLCGIFDTPARPRLCIQSPWALTTRDTLIVRNRYRRLPCYKAGRMMPAYRAFAGGLRLLFGDDEAARITRHLDDGGGDIHASMLADRRDWLNGVVSSWNMAVKDDRARPKKTSESCP